MAEAGRRTVGVEHAFRWRWALAGVVLWGFVIGASARAADQGGDASSEAGQETLQAPRAAAPESTAGDEKSEKTPKKWLRGSFETGLDAAWSDRDSDINLDQTLRVKIDPPNHERIHIRASLWLREDLDGDESRTSGLRDVDDAYGSSVRFRPLYMYVDVDDLWGDSTLRLGRQRIQEGTAWNRIDGLYFKQRAAWGDWYVFAGARASLYTDAHRDFAGGGGVSFRPAPATRIALDGYYGTERDRDRDETFFWPLAWGSWFSLASPRAVSDDREDHQISLSAWQAVGAHLMLYGRLTEQSGAFHSALLSATGTIPAWNLTYEAAYRAQTDAIGDRLRDLGGFYQTVGRRDKRQDLRLALHRPLTEKWTLSLESEFRRSDAHASGFGNRDYDRYAAILSAEKLRGGIDATVGLAWWRTDRDQGSTAVTAEVAKKWSRLSLALGADFERYEDRIVYHPLSFWADQFTPGTIFGAYPFVNRLLYLADGVAIDTRENVRSIYGKAKWTVRPDHDVNARVSYETDSEPDSPYWRVQMGYVVRF